jgi:hypothetical protein
MSPSPLGGLQGEPLLFLLRRDSHARVTHDDQRPAILSPVTASGSSRRWARKTERLYKPWARIRLLVIQIHDPKLRGDVTRIAKAY